MRTLPILLLFLTTTGVAQRISASLPDVIHPAEKFLFYLHGGIVTVAGDNAINPSAPEWGPYEYTNILDALQKRGFNVISENRKVGIADSVYANRLIHQIDTLLENNVPTENIIVVGASAGWDIALRASSELKNTSLHFVLMGGCWPKTHEEYLEMQLFGHFLSIIESSDPHGTCKRVFEKRKVSSFKEVKLRTGLSHGFIYRGLAEWIDPLERWHKLAK